MKVKYTFVGNNTKVNRFQAALIIADPETGLKGMEEMLDRFASVPIVTFIGCSSAP